MLAEILSPQADNLIADKSCKCGFYTPHFNFDTLILCRLVKPFLIVELA